VNAQEPARTIEDALKELRALYRQRQALQRAGLRKIREAEEAARLQQKAARSRAAVDGASDE